MAALPDERGLQSGSLRNGQPSELRWISLGRGNDKKACVISSQLCKLLCQFGKHHSSSLIGWVPPARRLPTRQKGIPLLSKPEWS